MRSRRGGAQNAAAMQISLELAPDSTPISGWLAPCGASAETLTRTSATTPKALFVVSTAGALAYARVFSDEAGRSRLEGRTIVLDREIHAPPAAPLRFASLVEVFGLPEDVMVVAGDSSWAGLERHPAPARLLWAILAGEWQVTVDDAQPRSFRSGELILFEDTAGDGHSSRVLSDDALALVLRLA